MKLVLDSFKEELELKRHSHNHITQPAELLRLLLFGKDGTDFRRIG
jgi:hypothetical protein